jgi:hypothetical protein
LYTDPYVTVIVVATPIFLSALYVPQTQFGRSAKSRSLSTLIKYGRWPARKIWPEHVIVANYVKGLDYPGVAQHMYCTVSPPESA